jgi:hypothetical protein
MKDLLPVLERIATALEAVAEMGSSRAEEERKKWEIKNRRRKRFSLEIENDKRFPGLLPKVLSCHPLSEDVIDKIMERSDAVALINYLVHDLPLLKRIDAMEPDEVSQEIARIEQRLNMRAV